MKKIFFALLVFVATCGFALDFDILSYPPPVDGGNVMVDAGIGLTAYGSTYGTISIPPIFLNVEYALPASVPISVGGFAAFYRYNYRVYDNSGWQYTFFTFGGKANWHWGFDINWLDLYSGMWIGYNVFSANWVGDGYGYTSPSHGGIGLGFQVGAHFYFKDNIGLVLESGYPFALKTGVALKFGGNNGYQGTTSSSAQQRNSRSANNARLLNGTWVSNGDVITFKNGKFEWEDQGTPFVKGTYTTNDSSITIRITHFYVEGKYHSTALLMVLGAPKEDFEMGPDDYSISDDGLYLFFLGKTWIYYRR